MMVPSFIASGKNVRLDTAGKKHVNRGTSDESARLAQETGPEAIRGGIRSCRPIVLRCRVAYLSSPAAALVRSI